MKCPKCGIFNVPSAVKCDCGYDFRSGSGGDKSRDHTQEMFDGDALVALGWLLIFGGITLAMVAGLRASPVLGWGAYLVVRGRRKRGRSNGPKLKLDSRSPILYLRPFSADFNLSDERIRFTMSTFGFIPRTQLERLSIQLKKVGPFVCIGKPGEFLPHAGPDSIYVEEANWKNAVRMKMKESIFVVFRAGFNWNTVQEMDWAKALGGPTRILFWFPDENDVDYMDFRRLAPSYLPCNDIPEASHVRFVYFDENWKVIVVGAGFADLIVGFGWSVWTSLSPFLRTLGIENPVIREHLWKSVTLRTLPLLACLLVVLLLVHSIQ